MAAECCPVLSRRVTPEVRENRRIEAERWFRSYLQKPHELIGRKGDVCPFASIAEEARTLEFEVIDASAGLSVGEGRQLVEEMVGRFHEIPWAHANRSLHCLVVVLHGLASEELPVLDRVQRESKSGLAARGLMLGQFHPRCPEPAARNPLFKVAISPLPMLALRTIALHDILFLNGDERCFRSYEDRFGERYVRRTVVEPLFVQLYWAARERFAVPERPVPAR